MERATASEVAAHDRALSQLHRVQEGTEATLRRSAELIVMAQAALRDVNNVSAAMDGHLHPLVAPHGDTLASPPQERDSG